MMSHPLETKSEMIDHPSSSKIREMIDHPSRIKRDLKRKQANTSAPIHYIDPEHDSPGSHRLSVGISLALGFAFMFIIDTLSHSSHSHSSIPQDPESQSPLPHPKKKSTSATIGLVIHSAADGIALGAVGHGPSQWIIFIALMLHKAPSALALTAFLIKDSQSRKTIKSSLFAFSIAAPLMALITSTFLNIFQLNNGSKMYWTACILLFSAGTFLYVSTMHIMPEIYITPSSPHPREQLPGVSVLLVLLGIFTPVLISMGVLMY